VVALLAGGADQYLLDGLQGGVAALAELSRRVKGRAAFRVGGRLPERLLLQ